MDKNYFYTSDVEPDRYLKVNSCGFQAPNKSGRVLRERGRHDYHIILVTGGSMEAEQGAVMHSMKTGDIMIYAPGEKQFYCWEGDASYLWLHFNGTSIQEIICDFAIKGGAYEIDYNKSIFESFSRLVNQFSQPALRRFVNGTLLTLLANISCVTTKTKESAQDNAMVQIIAYINMNYNKKISIDELVARSGYSRSRFFKLFSQTAHAAPIEYQQTVRLNNARELLSASEYSISEIAYCCGFDDPLYFSRVFKKKYGISPREYKFSDKKRQKQ